MWQTVVVAALALAAAVYIGLKLRRSLAKPSCLCDDPGACPYAQAPPEGGACPHHH